MLDHLKTERQGVGIAMSRLGIYMVGLLVLGAIILGLSALFGAKGPEDLPEARPSPEEEAAEAPVIDLDQLPTEDSIATQTRYQTKALDYLFSLADRNFIPQAHRLSLKDLDALSFAEARGRVFVTRGTVEEIVREEYGPAQERLWSVLLVGEDGSRVIVLKHGLGSDPQEGRPEDALKTATDYIEAGDDLLVRGIYLQRRVGSIGSAILRDPVPVLVATPPQAAFRDLLPPAVPIADPGEADWDDVKDRFLRDTQVWADPALFQVAQWAKRYGYDRIVEDIRSGKLAAEPWDREMFDLWGEEVDVEDPGAPRPVTESLRGRFFRTTGIIGSFVREGWTSLPREASEWDVNTLYLLDLPSDYWANKVLRNWTPFPLETFPGITGKGQHVTIYGYFLKNHTYKTQYARGGAPADLTMPMFIVLQIEPSPPVSSSFRTLIWVISGVIVLLFVVFYVAFMRGEQREARRLEGEILHRRRRRRELAARKGTLPESAGGEGGAAGEGEAGP